MFPIRDTVPSRTFPFVNLLIIAANAAVFLYEVSLGGRALNAFILTYGLVPVDFASPRLAAGASFLPFVSSTFLHGGWMHAISNMWMLYIFGDNVEDRLGHFRYLVFYLLCGIAANCTQLWASWGSPLPTIGASGAIAGVMGAYFILFPHARVVCLVPIFIFLQTIELPATLFLGVWLITQLYSGALVGAARLGGIAWWAHIGGFLAGIMLLGVFLKRRPGARYA